MDGKSVSTTEGKDEPRRQQEKPDDVNDNHAADERATQDETNHDSNNAKDNNTEGGEEHEDGKEKNSKSKTTKETNVTNQTKVLPPTCKACFIEFAERRSPACAHQFCAKCYAKLETKVIILFYVYWYWHPVIPCANRSNSFSHWLLCYNTFIFKS